MTRVGTPNTPRAIASIGAEVGLGSAHVLFPDEPESAAWETAGWLRRLGVQYHWHNRGYATFEDFLGSLASRKRKQIRKERAPIERPPRGFGRCVVRGGEVPACPAPYPERLIGADPDYYFESCLVAVGGKGLDSFDPDMLAEYRRCWRDPAMIHASTTGSACSE